MKQELIDRFELEHPNEPAYLPIVGGKEHLGIETSRIYSDAFQNWLMDTVIAELQSELNNKEQAIILFKELNEERDALQEKYDKLKDRLEGAPTLNVRRDETIIDNGLSLTVKGDSRLHIEDNGNRAWTQMWTKTALVELKPNEIDSCHTSGNG